MCEFPHQGVVVRCDENGRSQFVYFGEQVQQSLCKMRLEVFGWLVGYQQFRSCDDGACDADALSMFFGEAVQGGMHTVVQSHPVQQCGHVMADLLLFCSEQSHGQRDVVERVQMCEQSEVLKDDADILSQECDLIAAEYCEVSSEKTDIAFPSAQAHVDQAQERRLPHTALPDDEMKRSGLA